MTQHAADATVLVFARAPLAGSVKTRLVPALGARGAAALHARMVRHTLRTACAAAIGQVELWCAPSVDHAFFGRCAADFGVTLAAQEGADLGTRMDHALTRALLRGYALVIGTDCPALTADDLRAAAAALCEDARAVIAPAEDGGYVLIGLRRREPRLFSGIDWGSASVMAQTRARLAELGWTWRELEPRWDVDRPEDLARLARERLIELDDLLPLSTPRPPAG
jgi:hypothetical protein